MSDFLSNFLSSIWLFVQNPINDGFLLIGLVSVIFGIWKGFARSFLSLVIWVLAFLLPVLCSGLLAPHLSKIVQNQNAQFFLAILIIFLLVLILGWVLGKIVKLSIDISGLSGIDRLFGFIFGVLRAIVILGILTSLISLTALSETHAWKTSELAQSLNTAVENIVSCFPQAWTEALYKNLN